MSKKDMAPWDDSPEDGNIGGEGDYVVATWGPMKFAPIQFHSFDVGPFLYRTRIAPDETPEEALNRAYAWCEKQGRAAFRRELDTFLECAALARSGARG